MVCKLVDAGKLHEFSGSQMLEPSPARCAAAIGRGFKACEGCEVRKK
jgi:hypothetical protein